MPKGVSTFQVVRTLEKETDGEVFIDFSEWILTGAQAWTHTRGGDGDYYAARTAGAATVYAVLPLSKSLMKKIGADPQTGPAPRHDVRGVEITAIDLVYFIGTAALTTHTYDIHRVVHANNAAPSVTSTVGGTLTGALATATQAQPYLTTITVGTPFVTGGNVTRTEDYFQVLITDPGTAVYRLYGAYVRYNYNIH